MLAGGGTASGPVSFMKGYDAFAGVIKSGGKTRRAAKMVILNADHPDILDFIESKEKEEKKAWALIEAGYDPSFTGEAYGSVYFQNANHSVRVTDEFMQAVVDDKDWTTHAVVAPQLGEHERALAIFRETGQRDGEASLDDISLSRIKLGKSALRQIDQKKFPLRHAPKSGHLVIVEANQMASDDVEFAIEFWQRLERLNARNGARYLEELDELAKHWEIIQIETENFVTK